MQHNYLLIPLLSNTKDNIERIKDIFRLLYMDCYREFRIVYVPNVSISIADYSNEDLENICNMDNGQGKITAGVQFFNKLIPDSVGVTMDIYVLHPIEFNFIRANADYGEPITGIMNIDEISNVEPREDKSESIDHCINNFLLSITKLQAYYHMLLEHNNMREKIIKDNYIVFDVLDDVINMSPFYIEGKEFKPLEKYANAFNKHTTDVLTSQGLCIKPIPITIMDKYIYYYNDIYDIKKHFINAVMNKKYDGAILFLFPDPSIDISGDDIEGIDRMIIYCKKIIAPYSNHEVYIMNSIYSTFSKAPKCFTNLFEFNIHFDNFIVDILSAGWHDQSQYEYISKEDYLDKVRFRLGMYYSKGNDIND